MPAGGHRRVVDTPQWGSGRLDGGGPAVGGRPAAGRVLAGRVRPAREVVVGALLPFCEDVPEAPGGLPLVPVEADELLGEHGFLEEVDAVLSGLYASGGGGEGEDGGAVVRGGGAEAAVGGLLGYGHAGEAEHIVVVVGGDGDGAGPGSLAAFWKSAQVAALMRTRWPCTGALWRCFFRRQVVDSGSGAWAGHRGTGGSQTGSRRSR